MILNESNALRYNAWKYMYDEDKDCYISVIATTGGKGIAIENGEKIGKFDRFMTVFLKGYDWFLLVNDDVSITDIETELASGNYSKIYCFAKAVSNLSHNGDTPESNIKNLTIDYVYCGNNEFIIQNESATDENGYRYLSPLNLSGLTDCSDYKISNVFRINADFIHENLRSFGGLRHDRMIDSLYSIQDVTSEYNNSGNGEDIIRFSPSMPLDANTYDFFVSSNRWKYCYNVDTEKYVSILRVSATSEHSEYYSIFEDGERIDDFNQFITFDNEKTNSRHVVYYKSESGERTFTLKDLESKLKNNDFSRIYYIGEGNLDVLFSWLNK